MGAGGIIDSNQDIPIFAPEGFVEAVLSESILAGPAMRRRAAFMYGNALPRGPDAQIGVGLGLGSSTGSASLILPNILVQKTGEEHIIDGVRFVFQMIPGAEAPAELNFHLPDFRALCIPETSTNCMHNVVSLGFCLKLSLNSKRDQDTDCQFCTGYSARRTSQGCKGMVRILG
jgi:alkyl sulfatase BDS1-like metallo-beta-lactamase superfamily hydrolase